MKLDKWDNRDLLGMCCNKTTVLLLIVIGPYDETFWFDKIMLLEQNFCYVKMS